MSVDIAAIAADVAPDWKNAYRRPVVDLEKFARNEDYYFMLAKIDYITSKSLGPDSEDRFETDARVPLIRISGVDQVGNSLTCFVHGYKPYFYFAVPSTMNVRNLLLQGDAGLQQLQENVDLLRNRLNAALVRSILSGPKARKFYQQQSAHPVDENGSNLTGDMARCVQSVELEVKKVVSIGYDDNRYVVIRATCALPEYVKKCRDILEQGFAWHQSVRHEKLQTYESNIPFVLRFMVDRNMRGMGWIRATANKFRIAHGSDDGCNTSVSLHANYEDLFGTELSDAQWKKVPPMRVLSFDIECTMRKGHFPEPEHDPVIQISNVTRIIGGTKEQQTDIIKQCPSVLFALRKTSSIAGARVLSFDTEEEMLQAWSEFVVLLDPDIIIGYNILNFDLPYLINRAKTLKVDEFTRFSRSAGERVTLKEARFSSKAYGSREGLETVIHGRCVFDVLIGIQREKKLRSYSLNSCSAEFLGMQKDDISHTVIPDLFAGTPDDRASLGRYCIKDALLAWLLFETLAFPFTYLNYARVSGVPFEWLLTRGQQIRVISLLLRKARQKSMILFTKFAANRVVLDEKEKGYGGAAVLDPKRGFYTDPIITLDFASLYPSIMISHNLCYTTLIKTDAELDRLLAEHPDWKLGEHYERAPHGHYFVKSNVTPSLLAEVLLECLGARGVAKKGMAEAEKLKDLIRKAILDGEQLAWKILANSVYGFTGALEAGEYASVEIASNVTAWGKEMIFKTRDTVEGHFGYQWVQPRRDDETVEQYQKRREAEKLVVLYGDTDSVMIKTVFKTFAEAAAAGIEMAKYITTLFQKPISLAFEKVYWPYLLIERKRYAGLFWTKPDKPDKLDTKGIETVRRDFCPLTTNTLTKCLNMIMYHSDIKGAVEHARTVVAKLYRRDVDITELVMCKSISKKIMGIEVNEDIMQKRMEIYDEAALKRFDAEVKKKYYNFKNSSPHLAIVKRNYAKDPANAPGLGSRVAYIVIQKHGKDLRVSDKAEEPLVAFEKGLPYDIDYYIERQLRGPLERLFNPIKEGLAKSIFVGDHANVRINELRLDVSHERSSIISHAYKIEKCLHCNTALSHEDACDACFLAKRIKYLEEKIRSKTYDVEESHSTTTDEMQLHDEDEAPFGLAARLIKQSNNPRPTRKRPAKSKTKSSTGPTKVPIPREERLRMLNEAASQMTELFPDCIDKAKDASSDETDTDASLPPLCRVCVIQGHSATDYLRVMHRHGELERLFSQYWSQCQRCKQSSHSRIDCSNIQCPIYFRRLKAQIDVKKSCARLVRFDRHTTRPDKATLAESVIEPMEERLRLLTLSEDGNDNKRAKNQTLPSNCLAAPDAAVATPLPHSPASKPAKNTVQTTLKL